MIISVDFDNTLAVTDYPAIICPIQSVIDWVKERQAMGDVIILNTCRHDEALSDAVDWCKLQGIMFDYVNENTKENIERFGDCRKIAADVNLDDKNIKLSDVYKEVLNNAETCISCGDIVPEGRQICLICESKAERKIL